MSQHRSKLIVVGLFAVLLITVALAVIYGVPPKFDAAGCDQAQVKRPIIVLILDQSNHFERGDLERTRIFVSEIVGSAQGGEKLLVLELSPDRPFEPSVIFEKCAPKRPEDGNIWLDDLNGIKAKRTEFSEAFWMNTKAAFERVELPKSPILETIAYTAARSDFRVASSRRIYLFSDLLQNYGPLDFYKKIPSPSIITDRFLHSENIDFSATRFFLVQAARRQQWELRSNLREFWSHWIRDRGAGIEFFSP